MRHHTYYEGFDAGLKDTERGTVSECPYPQGIPRSAWMDGYRDGKKAEQAHARALLGRLPKE